MERTISRPANGTPLTEPVWEIATLFPDQGQWSEEEYLGLETNRLVEFSDGHLEVLPMPTQTHQALVFLLSRLLYTFAAQKVIGYVLPAALRVRLWQGKYREPDVVFMLSQHAQRRHESYWEGADLVMEVVSNSPEDRRRDLVTKRREYAQAGISEYWIIDPQNQTIAVLWLDDKEYIQRGRYGRGEMAESVLLPEFAVALDEVFNIE